MGAQHRSQRQRLQRCVTQRRRAGGDRDVALRQECRTRESSSRTSAGLAADPPIGHQEGVDRGCGRRRRVTCEHPGVQEEPEAVARETRSTEQGRHGEQARVAEER
jgi:hypothetical protein